MNPVETEDGASIWERLSPEEGITKEHIEYLIDLGVGKLPRTDISYVKLPKERALNKTTYSINVLGIFLSEAAELSGWDDDRLKQAKERWTEGKKIPLPVSISILHDVIATCHLYEDVPEADREKVRPHLIDNLNLVLQARIAKRIEREEKMESGESVYEYTKERGMTIFPGFDHLPAGTLVNTLKRLEKRLKTALKDRSK